MKTYKEMFYLAKEHGVKDWNEIQSNKLYILADNFGSIYKDGTSVGYFTFGSIIEFKQCGAERVNAIIYGETFRVTQDASFGNTPSKGIRSMQKSEGYIPIKAGNLPKIIPMDIFETL